MELLNPASWPRPKGYSNGIAASGRMVFVAGQIGWNENEEFETDDFAGQFRKTLENICAVLKEGGAGPEHLVRLTMYFTSKQEYLDNLKGVGEAYRDVIGRNYPVMAAVQVVALMEDRAKVEIEATAMVGD